MHRKVARAFDEVENNKKARMIDQSYLVLQRLLNLAFIGLYSVSIQLIQQSVAAVLFSAPTK